MSSADDDVECGPLRADEYEAWLALLEDAFQLRVRMD